jgi:hypothetical protein
MYIGLHVKYRYCCQILMKLEFSRQIFKECWNTKFHDDLSNGSRFVPYGQTWRSILRTRLKIIPRIIRKGFSSSQGQFFTRATPISIVSSFCYAGAVAPSRRPTTRQLACDNVTFVAMIYPRLHGFTHRLHNTERKAERELQHGTTSPVNGSHYYNCQIKK